MNTGGHHSVAATAGLPVLRAALDSAGKDLPLHAFYMGNWLTDVSQAVDPVAYRNARLKIQGGLKDVHDLLKSLGNPFDLCASMQKTAAETDALLAKFLKPPPGKLRDSQAGLAARKAFFVAGYFKFACPYMDKKVPLEPELKAERKLLDAKYRVMDGDLYAHVFDTLYTQYYPHEHLDRPDKPVAPKPCSSSNKDNPYADKPDTGTRSPNRKQTLDPDLYFYLRDHIQIAAGLLADLDLNWARKAFDPKSPAPDRNDKDFHLNLARLGHALHPIEDFFAHSIFAERATLAIHKDAKKVVGADYTKFLRRLRKVLSAEQIKKDAWEKEPEETLIVTGYFDFQDTLVSLGHINEHLFIAKLEAGQPAHDPHKPKRTLGEEIIAHKDARHEAAEREDEACTRKFKKVFTDTLVFTSDRKLADSDPKNVVSPLFKNKPGPIPPEEVARKVIASNDLFKQTPKRINDEFVDAVKLWSQTGTIGGMTISLFMFFQHIAKLIEDPVAWIKAFFSAIGLPLLGAAIVKFGYERIYDALGQNRIGCHSLIAKDHGPVGLLYKEQKQCALAVHWYAIHTMTRWARPRPADVRRADHDASGSASLSTLDAHDWLDWLELLEYFLRNPAGKLLSETLDDGYISIPHVVKKGDSLATLAEFYGTPSRAFDHTSFSWRTIAAANFNLEGIPQSKWPEAINAQLKESGGFLCADGINYGWKEGTVVTIPRQRFKPAAAAPASPARAWFRFVMRDGWVVLKERRPYTKEGPLSHHVTFPISEEELRQQIKDADTLRKSHADAYVPSNIASDP